MFDLLKGIKVIDLTTIVLGPYATQFLGDFGADVIKVEAPGGDLFRSARPGHSPDMGAHFINCNRNKRSIVLDLRKPQGLTVLHELIASADVLVHNMRTKSAHKLGLAPGGLQKLNSKLIYCNACGFGSGGRYRDAPAYDDTLQAVSGVAALNKDESGNPRYLPTVLCDKVAGLHLAIAVLAGLAGRQQTGKTVAIETPMFETMASFLLVEHLSGQSFEPALGGTGYARLLTPMRKPFSTKDGFISILPYNTRHWRSFVSLIQRADLTDAPLINDPAIRSENLDSLYQLIADAAPRFTTDEWLHKLKMVDIPCTRVNDIDALLQDPHLNDVDMFPVAEHPGEGKLRSVRSPFSVAGAEQSPDIPAPTLGSDGKTILQELGFSEHSIQQLVDSGAIVLPDGQLQGEQAG